jgi:hypothetical protein
VTDQELLAQAAKLIRESGPLEEWAIRMRQPGYRWRNSPRGKALILLEQLKKSAPAPAPPANSGLGQRVVYFSNVTDYACQRFSELGPGYTARVTADPNPDYAITDAQIAKLKSKGGRVESWCDCHTTFLPAAKAMAQSRGLDGYSGEYESNAAWDHLYENVVDAIGNPNALSAAHLNEAIQVSASGAMRLIGEVMNPDPGYSAQGVNISSACYYVDRDDAQGGDLPLSAYSVMPAGQRATCSVYAAGVMTPADWDTFANWTRP